VTENDGYLWLRVVLDWLPYLIFIALLIYFMKRGVGGRQAQYMDASRQYQIEHLAETRKMQESLARIATALEKPQPPQ